MKLWHSFVKEMLLATRSFYFRIEILMAVIIVAAVFLLIPEQQTFRQDEYIYLDMPPASELFYRGLFLAEDEDNAPETVTYELDGATVEATLYQSDDSNVYVVDDEAQAIALADRERDFAGIIHRDAAGETRFTYYMQGWETERLRNIYRVGHLEDSDTIEEVFDAQEVRALEDAPSTLNDRQFIVPAVLALNGSLLSLFIIAAYVFLDKKEGVIKAYAVSASPVWHYLMSKAWVLIAVTLFTSLFIALPIMGLAANYPLMVLLLVTTGFFAGSLGLLLTSFYDDLMQSFGVLYGLILLLGLPSIAYFIPSWDPLWVRLIPSYAIIQSFRETLLASPDVTYVLTTSAGFLVTGVVLFVLANGRFKRTLTV